jgi:hypothetical protein
MSKAVRIEAPIEGALGNKVNVGDTVMVVTTGWGNTHCNKGKYLGYIEGKGSYPKRAQIEVQETAYVRYWNDGAKFTYGGERERALYNAPNGQYYEIMEKETTVRQEPYTRVTTLNLNRIATLKD